MANMAARPSTSGSTAQPERTGKSPSAQGWSNDSWARSGETLATLAIFRGSSPPNPSPCEERGARSHRAGYPCTRSPRTGRERVERDGLAGRGQREARRAGEPGERGCCELIAAAGKRGEHTLTRDVIDAQRRGGGRAVADHHVAPIRGEPGQPIATGGTGDVGGEARGERVGRATMRGIVSGGDRLANGCPEQEAAIMGPAQQAEALVCVVCRDADGGATLGGGEDVAARGLPEANGRGLADTGKSGGGGSGSELAIRAEDAHGAIGEGRGGVGPVNHAASLNIVDTYSRGGRQLQVPQQPAGGDGPGDDDAAIGGGEPGAIGRPGERAGYGVARPIQRAYQLAGADAPQLDGAAAVAWADGGGDLAIGRDGEGNSADGCLIEGERGCERGRGGGRGRRGGGSGGGCAGPSRATREEREEGTVGNDLEDDELHDQQHNQQQQDGAATARDQRPRGLDPAQAAHDLAFLGWGVNKPLPLTYGAVAYVGLDRGVHLRAEAAEVVLHQPIHHVGMAQSGDRLPAAAAPGRLLYRLSSICHSPPPAPRTWDRHMLGLQGSDSPGFRQAAAQCGYYSGDGHVGSPHSRPLTSRGERATQGRSGSWSGCVAGGEGL